MIEGDKIIMDKKRISLLKKISLIVTVFFCIGMFLCWQNNDIIDSSHSDKKVAVSLVKELSDIAKVYYVNGNHEKSIGIENYYELENELKDSGANIINNSAVKVQDDFWLVGIDDTSLNVDCEDTINEIIEDNKIPEDAFKVLLAHEPQLFDKFTQFDMVLCGHAHGGQFRIPFTNIGFVAPDQGFFPQYTAGKHIKNDTIMYISRGLGNSIIPFRIFNRPELVKITLDANS